MKLLHYSYNYNNSWSRVITIHINILTKHGRGTQLIKHLTCLNALAQWKFLISYTAEANFNKNIVDLQY